MYILFKILSIHPRLKIIDQDEVKTLLSSAHLLFTRQWSDLYFLILPNDHQLSDLFGEKIWGGVEISEAEMIAIRVKCEEESKFLLNCF